jgi:hypothetical protein
MIFRVTRDLNLLELEILQKAFGNGLLTIKENKTAIDLVSDEELEAALRSELTDIARSNGVSDAEACKDLFFAALSDRKN